MSTRTTSPTFVLELPLRASSRQAKHLRAHFEAARCLYNALLAEAVKRLRLMRADPRWQQAHSLPKTAKQERRASSPKARGADARGYRYYVQLVLEGVPFQKPKHQVGASTVGLDLGPSTAAVVPREGEAKLLAFCSELKADQRKKRRLQRKLDRQRRANNPQNYDEQGRVKIGRLQWKDSQGYQTTRRRLAWQERALAAHRKSLHGQLVHAIVRSGTTIITEKVSYRAWQKRYGKSVQAHAPGMFIERLKSTVASTGGILLARPHPRDQTVAILPWLPTPREKAVVTSVASV